MRRGTCAKIAVLLEANVAEPLNFKALAASIITEAVACSASQAWTRSFPGMKQGKLEIGALARTTTKGVRKLLRQEMNRNKHGFRLNFQCTLHAFQVVI